MTTLLIVSFGALALIVSGLYWGRRRYGPARGQEKPPPDDALRELYGQYWAEVRAATQTHLLGASADEEWLARIRERALYATVAERVSGESVPKSPQRPALLLLWWLLAAPGVLLGAAIAFYLAHLTAGVIYLILAIFLGGVTLGVVMMVRVAIRREDRLYSLPGPPPAWSARGARRLTGIGSRNTDLRPALGGSDERPQSSPS